MCIVVLLVLSSLVETMMPSNYIFCFQKELDTSLHAVLSALKNGQFRAEDMLLVEGEHRKLNALSDTFDPRLDLQYYELYMFICMFVYFKIK